MEIVKTEYTGENVKMVIMFFKYVVVYSFNTIHRCSVLKTMY